MKYLAPYICPATTMHLVALSYLCFAICSADAWPHSLLISSTASRLNYGSERIASGQDAEKHQFPYHVSLRNKLGHYCGGTLISEHFVATSASCFTYSGNDNFNISQIILGALEHDQNDTDVQVREIFEVIKHPEWGQDGLSHDLAIIRFEEPVAITEAVRPVKLVDGTECEFVDNVTLVGRGRLTGKFKSKKLQWVGLSTISINDCLEMLSDIFGNLRPRVFENSLCTLGSKEEYQGMMVGDFGGPLIRDSTGELVGVASWYIWSSKPLSPGGYQNLCYYREWVKNTTGV